MMALLKNWKVIALVAGVATAFMFGWQTRSWLADADMSAKELSISQAQTEAALKTRQLEQAAREVEQAARERERAVMEADELRNQEREVVERVVTEEVIKYVQTPGRELFTMPDRWVRIHNQAAAGAGDVSGAALPACQPDALAADRTTPVIPWRL